MRNPDRIDIFCNELAKQWHKVDDWRFGQLIINFLSECGDPFYWEEDDFLEKLYGLENYDVKDVTIDNANIFGLTQNNNKYIISVTPTEFGMTGYHVNDIKYNSAF